MVREGRYGEGRRVWRGGWLGEGERVWLGEEGMVRGGG